MDIDITIKNYRCFADSQPARIQLKNGFTALVGANNAGKSTLSKDVL
jgi:AAA15 family ATPase/GTPase